MSKRFIGSRQTTIAREIELTGTGVHSGAPVSVVLHPAEADTGLRFLVTKRGRIIAEIPADVAYVKNFTLCTVIGDDAGVTVGNGRASSGRPARPLHRQLLSSRSTARKCRSWTAAPRAFVEAIDEAGIRELPRRASTSRFSSRSASRKAIAGASLRRTPGFHLDVEIDFPTPLIGQQRLALEMSPGAFRNEISRARTFGFMRDVERPLEGRSRARRQPQQHHRHRRRTRS